MRRKEKAPPKLLPSITGSKHFFFPLEKHFLINLVRGSLAITGMDKGVLIAKLGFYLVFITLHLSSFNLPQIPVLGSEE